jgi:CheY-like chemotaxis protein
MIETQRVRVMVVDDDPFEMEPSFAALLDAGYLVSAASSVTEALDLARTEPFDLIILDMQMPHGGVGPGGHPKSNLDPVASWTLAAGYNADCKPHPTQEARS